MVGFTQIQSEQLKLEAILTKRGAGKSMYWDITETAEVNCFFTDARKHTIWRICLQVGFTQTESEQQSEAILSFLIYKLTKLAALVLWLLAATGTCFRNNDFTREWNQYAINKSTDYTWKPQILSKTLGITSVSAVLSSRPTLSATYHLCNIDGPLIHLVKYARVRDFTGPCFPVKIYDSVLIRE